MKQKNIFKYLMHLIFLTSLFYVDLISAVELMGIGVELVQEFPKETIILKLPDENDTNWKEITRFVNRKVGLMERIPITQANNNWSDLICIQYTAYHKNRKGQFITIKHIVDAIRNETFKKYSKNKVVWKIIEKNENDIIYEWIFQGSPSEPQEHELARAFLKDSGFHRIGITKKTEMSSIEKEKWIKILKENVQIVPFQEAMKSTGMSMTDKHINSLSLENSFLN